jgi:hypothetical protein
VTDKRKAVLHKLTRTPNSFRRGPSTRHARKLRRMVTRTKQARKALEDARLARAKRRVESNIQHLSNLLRPERIIELREDLAYWEAARDSLEDDGVMLDRKTFNA